MKIAHVITDMEIGGAQRLLSDILPLQVHDVHDGEANSVTLCVLQGEGDTAFMSHLESIPGLRIVYLNPTNKGGVWNMVRVMSKLRGILKQSDVAHVHLFPALYYVAAASSGLKCRLIYTEHSTFNRRRLKRYLRGLERLVYSRYTNVICISKGVRNNLAQWLGKDRNNTYFRIVHNGVPVSRFKEQGEALRRSVKNESDINNIRHKLFGRGGKPVLMISRFVESKDHPTFLRAIKEIDNKSIFAVLVGDGPRCEEYKSLVEELGIEDRVRILGSRSDISQLIAVSCVGVQSSNWEGFGLTVVEMMAGGLPVVISDVEGLAGVAEGCALTFPRGSYKDLAREIERLVTDTELRAEMINKGYERSQRYDISSMVDTYKEIYAE